MSIWRPISSFKAWNHLGRRDRSVSPAATTSYGERNNPLATPAFGQHSKHRPAKLLHSTTMASSPKLADLDFSGRIRDVFTSRSIDAFKALAETYLFPYRASDVPTESHDRLLHQMMEHILLLSSAHPGQVDDLIEYVTKACAACGTTNPLNNTDWGDWQTSAWELSAKQYAWLALQPSQGVLNMLFERLRPAYAGLGSGGLSTPDPEHYGASERKASISKVYGPTILLCRTFAKVPELRPRLWRSMEELLIVSTLSMPTLAADEYVSLALVIDGAGRSVDTWTREELKGVGKMWTPWMGAYQHPFDRWTLPDAMTSFLSHVGKGQTWMEEALTKDLLWVREETSKAAKALIAHGADGLAQEMSSKQLDDKYGWILEQLKDAPPPPGPMSVDEFRAKAEAEAAAKRAGDAS